MTFIQRRFVLLALLLALLAVAVFSPGLGGGFLLDDGHTIVNNPLIQVKTLDRNSLLDAAVSFHAGNSTRPLSMLSFGLDYWRAGGLEPSAFKATNLFLHGVTAFVLALFLRQLLQLAGWTAARAAAVALLVALVWAVHPLQVSAVLYVVQRMQTLATLFVVMALWAYLALRQAQMAGRPGWRWAIVVAVCWALALASKEDAILLPLYTLVLELTVLRFAAQWPPRARDWRILYSLIAVGGAALFFFWMLPHYWSQAPYPGRDFNSIERLMTQARVLLMYLGQILLPLPRWMTFNYDEFQISRGLLNPISTLLSMVALAGVLAWAWAWRNRRPVFACGLLLFFAGHVLTSNVIALELVFEHRNHFPLIGALLALADLAVMAVDRWRVRPRPLAVVLALLVAGVASAGAARAYTWGDTVRLAKFGVEVAPDSPRAWLALGGAYFDRAGRKQGRGSPDLDRAIETLEQAAKRTGSASAYSNVVIYKTIQGTVTPADWDRLVQRLEEVEMLPPDKNILWTTLENVRAKIGLDQSQATRVVDVISRRASFTPQDYLRMGVSLYLTFDDKSAALPYFLRAAQALPPDDPAIARLRGELVDQGHPEWAKAMEAAAAAPASDATPSPGQQQETPRTKE